MIWIASLLSVCVVLYSGFILRNAWVFARISCLEKNKEKNLPFVSIIIPARNESKSIKKCLTSVLNQSWPIDRFEVILINDHSSDNTKEIALALCSEFPNLIVLDLINENLNSYKKAAISQGIREAKGEIILQTDADCFVSNHWVKAMVSPFSKNTAYVSGPVQLMYRDNWFEKFQALESMGLITIGAGSLADRRPNMSNGANMAYRKAIFEEIKGFEGVDNVASGDDELLLQKIHKLGKYELKFAKCVDAIVKTQAVSTWQAFKSQRLRWVSKARAYHDKNVNLVQMISYLGFWAFPVLIVASFFNLYYLGLLGILFFIKLIADYFLMHQAARFFHKLHLLVYIVPLQLVYIPYVIWIGIAGNLVKNYTWKGRNVK